MPRVSPGGGGAPPGDEERRRHEECDGDGVGEGGAGPSQRQHPGRDAQGPQQDRDEPPAADRRERGEEAEAAGERPHDRAPGVPRVGAADVAAHVLAPPPEEGDQHRELHPRDDRGRQHHHGGDEAPRDDVAVETDVPERAEGEGERGEAVAEGGTPTQAPSSRQVTAKAERRAGRSCGSSE
jgi:hypothetical protein